LRSADLTGPIAWSRLVVSGLWVCGLTGSWPPVLVVGQAGFSEAIEQNDTSHRMTSRNSW